MKKVLFLVFLLLFVPNIIYADEMVDNRQSVKFVNCLSATSFWVSNDTQKFRIRLLGIDTEDGPLNNEIEEFVCTTVKNAQKLEIQYDEASPKQDKYHRDLVFVYVDGTLLQEMMLARGYGQVNFIQGNYANLDRLCSIQKDSIINKLGVWNYPDIEEAYCHSGIDIHSDNNVVTDVIQSTKPQYDIKKLKYLVFLNAMIIVLLLVLKCKKVGM